MRGLPVKQKDGSIILDAIGIEITKRKTAEQELAEINSNLEVLVEQRAEKAIKLAQELELYWLAAKHSKTGVWRYELATNSLHWDDTMHEIFGIAKEEFSGAYEAWETSLHPSDKEAAVAALNKSIETGEDLNILFRIIVKPSGEIRYVQGMGKIEQYEQGNTISAYGVNWDMTRDIEQAQKREEVI